MLVHGETVGEHDLAEDLRGNLEVLVIVVVLEEALGIKSVTADDFLEAHNDIVNASALGLASVLAPIFGFFVSITQNDVNALLEVLLSEHLVDRVAELSPADVIASFLLTGGESLAEHLEFGV